MTKQKPHTLLLGLSLLAMTLLLAGCSLLQRVTGKSSGHKHDVYAEADWKGQYIDEVGWQDYDWHSDIDTLRLRAIVDSIQALGEQVPDEMLGKFNRANYVETDTPQQCFDLVQMSKQYIGCKYGAGRMGPDRFDCSGFTSYIFDLNGIKLGRSSRDQFHDGYAIDDTRRLRPGDLVFWTGSNRRRGDVGHVGIVVSADPKSGNFTFIHAARTGIQIDRSEAEYYAARYMGARRVIY